jgi:hypothetical protein
MKIGRLYHCEKVNAVHNIENRVIRERFLKRTAGGNTKVS